MKKILSVLLSVFLTAGLMTGCGNAADTKTGDTVHDEKLRIVTTIFPEYDWVRQILGDKADDAELTLLLNNGVDLHSYQPSADDLITISNCDLFLYIGGNSDSWVNDALEHRMNQDMVVINLFDLLDDSLKEEELVEGMEHSHEGEDAHSDEEHDHEHEIENDEHIWLSLKQAKTVVSHIAAQLSAIDAANAASYTENASAYLAELDSLDAEYQETVDHAAFDTFLFADRFPFRYLADDYGIQYYAAFSGCSAESEASFETIAFLADKLGELKLPHVLTIETSTSKLAETIIENTENKDQTILTMDSMQSVTSKDIAEGLTYLDVMRANLAVLNDALN